MFLDRISLNMRVCDCPQVSEEKMDQANERKMEAIDALGEGGLMCSESERRM